jgi:hypothetical protein
MSSRLSSEKGIDDNENILSYIVVGLILISGLGDIVHVLTYSKYFIFLLIMVLLIRNNVVWDGRSAPFLLLLASGMLHFWAVTFNGLKDMFFIASYVIPFLVFQRQYINGKLIFLGVLLVYVITVVFSWKGGFEFSLLDSKSTLESHSFAFVFGLFCVYFLLTKQKLYLLLAVIMSILVLKRISLIAIFLIFLISILPRGLKDKILSRWVLISANFAYLFFCVYISSPEFDNFSQTYFDVSSSYLTMGRSVLYDEVFSSIGSSFFSWIFGNGFGSAYEVLNFVSWVEKLHLHNDVLRIFYEFGVIVFVLFFVYFYSGSHSVRLLGLYLNVVMLTDNIIVYTFVMFVFLYLSRELISNENTSST